MEHFGKDNYNVYNNNKNKEKAIKLLSLISKNLENILNQNKSIVDRTKLEPTRNEYVNIDTLENFSEYVDISDFNKIFEFIKNYLNYDQHTFGEKNMKKMR